METKTDKPQGKPQQMQGQETQRQAKPEQKKEQIPQQRSASFKHIVRIAQTDLDGSKAIAGALRSIKGVGFTFSNMVCNIANVEKNKKTGDLSDSEIKALDEIIRNPKKYGAPAWMLNRRKDYETGEDMHILTSELDFAKDTDIKRMKMIRSYVGMRHAAGLPVRGQRTKSNFRVNKGKSLGVKKKKPEEAAEKGKEK